MKQPALIVPDTELEAQYKKVLSMEARDAKRARYLSVFLLTDCVVSKVVIGGLAFALAWSVPGIRLEPILVRADSDGVMHAEVSTSTLPVSLQDAEIRATLSQYVMWRESYHPDLAKYAHDFVVALSSGEVGKQYEDWFNYPNPNSPQVWLGKEGSITTEEYYADFRGDDPNVYEIEYIRTVKQQGRPDQRAKYRAAIHFKRKEVVWLINRIKTNPQGIEVISYPDPVRLDPPTSQKGQ